MDIEVLKTDARRNLDNATSLMGVIPFLIFTYLLTARLGSLDILAGEPGYVALIAATLLLLGMATGRRMLWNLITRLFDLNEKNLALQGELIKKNRLAAVVETTLALRDEINNPVHVICGALELLENDIKVNTPPDAVKERFAVIKKHCDRITDATYKMAKISEPVVTVVHGKTKIIDLDKSKPRSK